MTSAADRSSLNGLQTTKNLLPTRYVQHVDHLLMSCNILCSFLGFRRIGVPSEPC